jgi:hypothetical protein
MKKSIIFCIYILSCVLYINAIEEHFFDLQLSRNERADFVGHNGNILHMIGEEYLNYGDKNRRQTIVRLININMATKEVEYYPKMVLDGSLHQIEITNEYEGYMYYESHKKPYIAFINFKTQEYFLKYIPFNLKKDEFIHMYVIDKNSNIYLLRTQWQKKQSISFFDIYNLADKKKVDSIAIPNCPGIYNMSLVDNKIYIYGDSELIFNCDTNTFVENANRKYYRNSEVLSSDYIMVFALNEWKDTVVINTATNNELNLSELGAPDYMYPYLIYDRDNISFAFNKGDRIYFIENLKKTLLDINF